MSGSRTGVGVAEVRALLRAFQLECEGVSADSTRRPLPRSVAGYFWPDDQQPDRETDGRSPLGVVIGRIRAEVDSCAQLGDDERLLLLRRHGLHGAVSRLTAADSASSLVGQLASGNAPLRPVDVAHARTTLHRAYWHLAQTLTSRQDDRATTPKRRANPITAPWFEGERLSHTDDGLLRIVDVALEVARQWCAVGGSRQDDLYADLSCWRDCLIGGRKSVRVVNLRGRLWRANAYVGIALYWTIASPGLVDGLCTLDDRTTSELAAAPVARPEDRVDASVATIGLTDAIPDASRLVPVSLAGWIQRAVHDGIRVATAAPHRR